MKYFYKIVHIYIYKLSFILKLLSYNVYDVYCASCLSVNQISLDKLPKGLVDILNQIQGSVDL